ncbi:hypothetical protein [uncultured Lactobacillus sp.]|uniref:hypothetical protein n=1 Tax=uncultured Lactobacillus sp. TaxID=153152 RepID=UPI0026077D12|nr:hypothetical protein [uncultured Lactobacillus sp.]
MVKIQLVYIVISIIVIGIFAFVLKKARKRKSFDLTPRDKAGNEIEQDDEDIENDPAQAPVYEGDFAFEDWESWEDFLADVGIIDIRDGMIEYETGDNSRKFIMLAEMQQSNPYLKTGTELNQANGLMQIFYNGIQNPLKITTQSQKVEMTDYLNKLKDHSQYLKNANKATREYAKMVIQETMDYQQQTDRFENRTYVQFQAVVYPDEVYGDSTEVIDKQIHEKALTKLLRQIDSASRILKKADHPLEPLDTFGLCDVLFKTWHRESSVKVRFEDIIRKQRFSIYTTAYESDKMFKEINQRVQIENDLIAHARDALWLKKQAENADKLARGEDYYDNSQLSYDKSTNSINDFDISELEKLD